MRVSLGPLVLALLAASACGPNVDLSKGLEVVELSSGWSDGGMINGQNKIVPTVTFKLKNRSEQKLQALQTNVVFRQTGKSDEWGSRFSIVRGSEGLAPGETTAPITLTSDHGYTSQAPKFEMFDNKQFVDATAELFAKYASAQWIQIRDLPVERRLVAR
jgi:hypothetical protein